MRVCAIGGARTLDRNDASVRDVSGNRGRCPRVAALARRVVHLAMAVVSATALFGAMARWPAPASAAPTIDVRVSVKVILRPNSATRPFVNATTQITDAMIQSAFDIANDSLLSAYWRGYRFRVTEIQDIGPCIGVCDSSDPGFWHGATLAGDDDLGDFERWARQFDATFLWRTDQVNVYINSGKGSGAVASFPPGEAIMSGGLVFDPANRISWPAAVLHHELGHYFSLAHPNGRLEDCCDPDTCITNGDGIEDTLPDGPCFTLDQLSTNRYGAPFAGVNATKQDSLLNMFWNNMCYLHPDQKDNFPINGFGHTLLDRLTELQLDRWTDTANGVRGFATTAKTRFITATICTICPPADGSSAKPYQSLAAGLSAAGSGDILSLRPGTYTGPATINQPVTLRATRRGVALITH